MNDRILHRVGFAFCALVWAGYAVLQLILPAHALSVPWFVVDALLATVFAVLAVRR